MRESIEELKIRAMQWEPKALETLSHLVEEDASDDEVEEYVEAFDDAAMLYALGERAEDGWVEFRSIVDKYNEWLSHQGEAKRIERIKESTLFDQKVLGHLLKTKKGQTAIAIEANEVVPHAITMLEYDYEKEKEQADFCKAWIDTAKTLLTHPRFKELSDTVLDELIESVAYALSPEGEEEDESFELSDHCDRCQAIKQSEA